MVILPLVPSTRTRTQGRLGLIARIAYLGILVLATLPAIATQ